MSCKSFLKIFLLVLIPFFSKAQLQEKKIDSLRLELKNAADDTVKMFTLYNLTHYYMESNNDSAMFFVNEGLAIAKKIDQQLWIANLLIYKSYIVQQDENMSLSYKICNEALAILDDKKKEKNVYVPKDNEFISDPEKYRMICKSAIFHQFGNIYSQAGYDERAIEYYKKEIQLSDSLNSMSGLITSNTDIGTIYMYTKPDSAFIYLNKALKYADLSRFGEEHKGDILQGIGTVYLIRGKQDSAKDYFQRSLSVNKEINNVNGEINVDISLTGFYENKSQVDSMLYYAKSALQLAINIKEPTWISLSTNFIANAWKMGGNMDSAFTYLSIAKRLGDSLNYSRNQKVSQFMNADFKEEVRQEKEAQERIAYQNKIRTITLFFGLGILSILVFIFYRNNRQKQKANKVLEKTLTDLKSTQTQLIQSEKMASLGELTAGIAHEIQNPLNFVNNFSEVSSELMKEMVEEVDKGNTDEVKAIANDIVQNLEKINHHGKRADAIVKGMLQHSRSSSGIKEPTDINALCDEYLRLSYHGLRAKDKSVIATIKTDFDNSIGKINIIPQDIGRVIMNLLTNAFYAVNEKKQQRPNGYEPTVLISTKKAGSKIEIRVGDNGNGIPAAVKEKIFQPFFTTKPTGQGTGLGLSLSYDIIKAHGGEIKVEMREEEGSEFIIQLPNT